MAALPEVTDADFQEEVLGSDRPVVVDFWAPWCGPCRIVDPIIADLAEQHGDRIKFVKMNVDDNPATSSRYGILSIPTVTLFVGGEPQEAVIGARPKTFYERAWERWLGAPAR